MLAFACWPCVSYAPGGRARPWKLQGFFITNGAVGPLFAAVALDTDTGQPLSSGFNPPYPGVQIDQQPDFISPDLNRITSVIQEDIRGLPRYDPPVAPLL